MAISPMTRAGPRAASAILFSFESHVYCCTFCGSLLKPSKTCLFLIGVVAAGLVHPRLEQVPVQAKLTESLHKGRVIA